MKKQTQSKHTPGPWQVEYLKGAIGITSPRGDGRYLIAEMHGEPSEEDLSNAALIASVPSLLCQRDNLREALKACVAHLEQIQSAVLIQARAALANATESGVSL